MIKTQANSDRERDQMRRGCEGGYPILVTVLFIFRHSAILSAPIGPISFLSKLIQREREREREREIR
jgi:hypothetical protein